MRWRWIVLLLVFLPWCLGGCLDMFTRASSPASASRSQDADSTNVDLPTPQLFDFSLDISEP